MSSLQGPRAARAGPDRVGCAATAEGRPAHAPSASLGASIPQWRACTATTDGDDVAAQRDEPGIGEKIKGTFEETAGKMTGNEDTEHEGAAQQKRAQKSDEAARHEEEADRKRAEQDGHKGDQVRRED